MALKRKKGSALLVVVGMFAFLSIMIISVMSMTTTGFKLKKDQNTRVENFYGADSGIEIAKNISIRVINDALVDASSSVDKNKPYVEQNKEFKDAYKIYILAYLENEIEKEDNYKDLEFKRKNEIIDVACLVKLNSTKEDFSVEVDSTFTDENTKNREVSFNYDLKIPDYNEFKVKSEPRDMGLLNFLMGADGNMTINANSSFNLLGDIWVKGDKGSEDHNPTYGLEEKYFGGITIRSDEDIKGNVGIHGDLATGGTLRFDNIQVATVEPSEGEHEFFSDNIVYRARNGIPTNIPEYNLYSYNDFLFDSTSELGIGNYYGLNDINNYEKPSINDFNKDLAEWDKSSAVIMNIPKDSNGILNITKDMVIMGTSYIDLEGKAYQSGESIILNNSSKPYTERDKPFIYEYRSPLHIMNYNLDDTPIDLSKKISISDTYYDENPSNINGSLVTKDIYSVGTTLGLENKDVTNIDIDSKQLKYANRVFGMTNDLTKPEQISSDMNLFWDKEMTNSVANSIDTAGMRRIIGQEKIIKDGKEILVRKEFKSGEYKGNFAIFKEGQDLDQGGVKRMNVIFNDSGKPLIIDKSMTDAAGVGKFEIEDDCIRVGLDYAKVADKETVPTMIISTSDIDIKAKTMEHWDIRGLFYSFGDLNVEIPRMTSGMNFGNYGAELNDLFKEFLATSGLGSEIGGDISSNKDDIDVKEFINIEDLIDNEKWELKK